MYRSERELEAAERHIREGAERLVRQRHIVARLAAHGHDTQLARQILQTLEELQAAHIAGRDLLRRDVAQTRHGKPHRRADDPWHVPVKGTSGVCDVAAHL